ncbi:hypothetical protein BKA60DRAFT_556550 [Fusarium oxysporum]|nr:hypothetical protein BKA60DRAFT_556550 [Fusarium oxysporum]
MMHRLQEMQKRNSGTGNRTLGSAVLVPQVMRARNVSHYTIPDVIVELMLTKSLQRNLID